jgi:hypothetical protein
MTEFDCSLIDYKVCAIYPLYYFCLKKKSWQRNRTTIILANEIYNANNNGRYQNTDLYNLYCLFVNSHTSNFSAILRLSPFAANVGMQWGFIYVPKLLRHGTTVYTVSSKGPVPTSHSGIQTCDVRIFKSLRRRSNHSASRATSFILKKKCWTFCLFLANAEMILYL